MALNKDIETSSGVVASYWRIIAVYTHRTEKLVEIKFSGYVSEDKRRELTKDGQPRFKALETAAIRLGGDDYDAVTKDEPNPSYATLYTHLLTMPQWEGAKSV